jgi:hypothetical protein
MNRLQTSLFKAGLRVFEDLGFMLPNEDLNPEQAGAEFEAGVSIDFYGPQNGTLILQIHGGILPILAANMLGEDEPPPFPQQQDALKELANVICGNLLPLISGTEAVFDLGEPRIREAPFEMDPKQPEAAAQKAIGLENGNAILWLFLKEGTGAHG